MTGDVLVLTDLRRIVLQRHEGNKKNYNQLGGKKEGEMLLGQKFVSDAEFAALDPLQIIKKEHKSKFY